MTTGNGVDPLGVELVNIERGWHSMALKNGDELGVVDIDVSPDFTNPYSFRGEDEVHEALTALAGQAEGAADSIKDIDFIREKIRAHLMHMRISSGEEVGIKEHVEATMGTSLQMIDEDILDAHRQALDRQLMDAPPPWHFGPKIRLRTC